MDGIKIDWYEATRPKGRVHCVFTRAGNANGKSLVEVLIRDSRTSNVCRTVVPQHHITQARSLMLDMASLRYGIPTNAGPQQ